jgi:hypothetical protein
VERGIIVSFQGIRIYQERIRIKNNLAPGLGGVLCGKYVGGTSAKVSLSIYQWKIRIFAKKLLY